VTAARSLPDRHTPTATPTATYRLQLQPAFTLREAAAAVPYLASLGVSHLHLSPLLEAAPGSTHGYDTVDHTRVSEQLGGEPALRALAGTAHAHGLGLIADTVPNHMAVPVPERLNRPLWQTLRDGPGSPFARWFDIDWEAQDGRVLLPLLGAPLGEVLDELEVTAADTPADTLTPGGAELRYHGHALPLRPGTEKLPLAELTERQWYRPAWWRLGRTELNYRRFFTVSDLIAVRVEDEEVFEATHAVLLRLYDEGVLDGFRIDHPDGLADPRGYLRRLAARAPGAYITVEKILTGEESLPADWPCAGTTGYDALHRIDGVLIDPVGAAALAAGREPFAEAARAGRAAMTGPHGELAAEVERLARAALRAAAELPEAAGRDHAPWAVRAALAATLTAFPVYRPYVVPGEPPSAQDTERVTAAAREARAELAADPVTAPYADSAELVRDLALGALGRGPARDEFCARFGQTAAAVAAKGVEDTAFYRWTPLLCANEVGGEPGAPAVAPAAFHEWCARTAEAHPHTMTALSTHDTKRSADARARLAVLAEIPDTWTATLDLLSRDAPDPAAAEQFWQTAVATWPEDPESAPPDPDRIVAALLKAVREAKLRTSWTEPDQDYEQAVEDHARACLADPGLSSRVDDLVRSLAPFARANSLSAALLHLTVPGVPDLYQGSEEPLRTLVDPDNRRPVDFAGPAARLAALDAEPSPRDGDDGGHTAGAAPLAAEKLRLTATALRLRRAHPAAFASGYEPLPAAGPAAGHLLAFRRGAESGPERAVTVVTRLPYGLMRGRGWHGTELRLPPGSWTDLLAPGRPPVSGRVPAAELLGVPRLNDRLPVALLVPSELATGEPAAGEPAGDGGAPAETDDDRDPEAS